MGKVFRVLIILVLLLLIIGVITAVVLFNWYNKSLTPVGTGKTVRVEIKKGTGMNSIAKMLEENKAIKNSTAFRIYCKLNNITDFKAGIYEFDTSKENVEAIAKKIVNGDVADVTVKLTLIEGKKFEDYARLIVEKTNNKEEDVYNLLKDEEYIDSLIEKYWFLTDEIKNEDIYYALEGYLKADTYVFEDKDVSVKYIFNYVLNYTDKLLSKYKEDIENSGLTVHEILTMASIVEKECSIDEYRSGVAGVFYNRLKSNMSLGSDVTTYYAFGLNLAENDLSRELINTYNPYNTRGPKMNGKLPVGPICSPSEESIKAALYPDTTDYYYFVSDKNEKTYFTKTYAEHQKIIQELKDKGLWFVYE